MEVEKQGYGNKLRFTDYMCMYFVFTMNCSYTFN